MERWLIEGSSFKGLTLSKVGKFTASVIGTRKLAASLLASSFICASTASFDARALGVGAAEPNSYIGEQLSVRIPLFNVLDPNSLRVNFQSKQFDGVGQTKVNAVLDRSNSQLSIKLSSDEVVNEPYVSFRLDLVDRDTEFSKEFVVLMDLRGGKAAISDQPATTFADNSSKFVSSTENSLMGPYDTAQAGNIAQRFGAVLDGQSLWRVARRINEAMGVSRSQMMWSLYQANPDAFSSRSVSSLKAGSYLTIPDESIVKSVSDAQAKAKLAELRLASPKSDGGAVAKVGSDTANEFGLDAEVREVNGDTKNDVPKESPFQVTGIDSGAQGSGDSDDVQSQQIIASLTETVGNLSQQLVRKDQKIEFLEKQVVELKSFIGEGVTTEAVNTDTILEVVDEELSSDTSGADSSATKDKVDVVSDSEQLPIEAQPSSVNGEVASVVSATAQTVQATPLWQWALLLFFALSVLAYSVRERLLALLRSLNLFGSVDQVEFDSVAVETPSIDVRQEPEVTSSPPPDDVVADKDYSLLNAVEKSMADKGVLDGISYLDLADDGSYEENEILEFEADEIGEDLEDLSFDERFERLLAERDFDFARELLDFARYNEINDERYHCERLRLLEKMQDEDGFYEYYYEIESKIPTFPQNLQTQISQLVVQLAHH